MFSAAFLIAVCLSVRLQPKVFEKLEWCTKACKIQGPSCGDTESCYCGVCSASDLCAACGPGEACLGGTCYTSFLEDEQETSFSLRSNYSDCQCENGEVCYWGMCIDTSEGATDDEDDPCYNCENCWFESYCLDPFEDTDECNTACASVECSDGYECYCGECISDEDIEDTSSSSSENHAEDDRPLIFVLTLALVGAFFATFGYLMHKKYLVGDSRGSDSVNTKIWRPGVENYGRMNHPEVTPNTTRSNKLGQYREHRKYTYSFSSSGDSSSDGNTLNTLKSGGVGRPRNHLRTPVGDKLSKARDSARSKFAPCSEQTFNSGRIIYRDSR